MQKLMVLHGPNLNLLGERETHIYGKHSLENLNQLLRSQAQDLHYDLECFQSNSEADLINKIHLAKEQNIQCIIFNPAAFTHTSIALRDALLAVQIPFIEVHLSNIYAREPFRQQSYFSDIALAVLSGCAYKSYEFALLFAHDYLTQHQL